MVIGSVYVPPGDMNAINALDTVIGKILQSHQKLLIGMDANARNSLWDYECVSVPLSRKSTSMGVRLEEILDKYGLQLHNQACQRIAQAVFLLHLMLQSQKELGSMDK